MISLTATETSKRNTYACQNVFHILANRPLTHIIDLHKGEEFTHLFVFSTRTKMFHHGVHSKRLTKYDPDILADVHNIIGKVWLGFGFGFGFSCW